MDKSTFAKLYMEQLPGLYRLALSRLRHAPDAEDAVQQAAVNAWQARDRLPPGAERAWLARIVINACRDIQRQRMRMVPGERLPEKPEAAPDPDLRDALDSLPEKLRIPVLLKYMEGWSEREIAAALHVTLYAVKSRLRRGRAALADALREEETP